MGAIRKWIVRNFELGTWVKTFGKTWVTLRAPRVIVPTFVFSALLIMGNDPTYYHLHWWGFVLLGLIALVFWLGFNFFNKGYFGFFPYTYDELDDEQKHLFLSGIRDGKIPNPEQDNKIGFLLPWQAEELAELTKQQEERYKGYFGGLKNLIPLGVSLLGIIIWYLWIAQ